MHWKHRLLTKLAKKPTRAYAVVFGLFLLLHVFVFDGIISHIPAIIRGDAAVVREELVPFFSFDDQYFSEDTSSLTSSDDARVAYSFWAAWVRFNPFLPFALVIVNTVAAFILFYAFHRIGRQFYGRALIGVASAAVAALLVHIVLLYAKVAHFYVLIIGFSMFCLSLSLICEQLYFRQAISKKNIAVVSLLVLFNPAIHYHVLFYFIFAVFIVALLILVLYTDRRKFWRTFKSSSLYLVAVGLLSGIPYIGLITLTAASSMTNAAAAIPVNYYMVKYASLSLPFIFSLNSAGHLDLLRHGNYVTEYPRAGTIVVTLIIVALFVFVPFKRMLSQQRYFLVSLLAVLLFSGWMVIGYAQPGFVSFHVALGELTGQLARLDSAATDKFNSLVYTFINILRFPHRFQFIYFYAAGVLLTLGLPLLRKVLMERMGRGLATALVLAVGISPILLDKDYRDMVYTGNLAGFAAPYAIPDDLDRISGQLARQDETKLFILPTLESGREIADQGNKYSFIDKFLIYKLNQPTLYYGAGGNTENKIGAYLVYYAINHKQKWWEDVMARNLGITNIVVPHKLEDREKGITYFPGIEKKIDAALADSVLYRRTYSGGSYSLYTLRNTAGKPAETLVDMEWSGVKLLLGKRPSHGANYKFPFQLQGFLNVSGEKKVVSDSIQRTYYNLYGHGYPEKVSTPDVSQLPFDPNLVASSNFTNSAMSMDALQSKSYQYNYLKEVVPSLRTLQTQQFIGITRSGSKLKIKLKAPSHGTYRLLVHGGSRSDVIRASLQGKEVRLHKLPDTVEKGGYIDFSYFYKDVALPAGTHELTVVNPDQNAVLVERAILMPSQDIPKSWQLVDTQLLRLKNVPVPSGSPSEYELTWKQAPASK